MASSFGAGAGADMLQEILRQKFTEALAKRQLRLAQQQAADVNTRFYSGQEFQSGENQKGRDFTAGENALGRTFTAAENEKGRAFTHGENEAGRTFTAGENAAGRTFTAGENAAGRAFTHGENIAGRAFQGEQGSLNRGNALRIAGMRSANEPVVRIQTVDSEGNPVLRILPRSQAAGQEFAAAPTTEQRNRQAATGRSSSVIKAIAELSERINTGQGALAKVSGATEKAKAAANLNDDISEYQAVVSGFTPLLARAVGHTGVLTEQDVQSVRKLLPDPGDSKSVRDRKIKRIESLMGSMSGPAGQGGGAKTIRARDPQGGLHEAPAGTALPKGWVLEK